MADVTKTKKIIQVSSFNVTIYENDIIYSINKAIDDAIKSGGNQQFLYEFGIQTLPGLKININGNPIIIGRTGILQVNVENYGQIENVKIISVDGGNPIADSSNFYFIIDMIFTSIQEGGV